MGKVAWTAARSDLEAAVAGAGAILAAWGVAGLRGEARRLMSAQVEWLMERAEETGIDIFWTVGGEPRHPSRWHQYVSDKYGRTTGGTFEERIAQVLVAVPGCCLASDKARQPALRSVMHERTVLSRYGQ